jgi:SAM domain (Sterile alpha motif)
MDIVVWLRSLGLGKYEAAFRENEIDEAVLPGLTAEDLKELGVAAGTAASCWMPLLLCARMRAASRLPLTWREAKSGHNLISPRVLMKVEKAVQVVPVGEFELKGIRRPLAAYNVVGAVSQT